MKIRRALSAVLATGAITAGMATPSGAEPKITLPDFDACISVTRYDATNVTEMEAWVYRNCNWRAYGQALFVMAAGGHIRFRPSHWDPATVAAWGAVEADWFYNLSWLDYGLTIGQAAYINHLRFVPVEAR